jgi:hypothetical protein
MAFPRRLKITRNDDDFFHAPQFRARPQTLKVTPAMAAGVTSKLGEMADMVVVLEAWDADNAFRGEN